jgi:hypothetical protein
MKPVRKMAAEPVPEPDSSNDAAIVTNREEVRHVEQRPDRPSDRSTESQLVQKEVSLVSDEAIPTAAHPDLKRRKLFPDGTKIVAAINNAERIQGKFAPAIAVDLKTILPELGYSLRHTAFYSTRKKDGSHYVKPGGDLDLLQQAALTDVEFFVNSKVDAERLIGRLVAFDVEVVEYKTEDGTLKKVNNIVEGSIRKPCEEELEKIGSTRLGAAILRRTAAAEGAALQALESPGESVTNGKNKALPHAEETDVEEEFENVPS